ncbi:hypothetical protein [Gemmata obscuriglobus]|uniref:Uncharacterized protein n=1 Tax=Gemmata obscuriglobus TaxID=114 RepID=A0A2Z3H732_9BACT|nr:hypothetical protein [Gemmata obscuriglobus]AWM39396.1 hypothetical protein C1280_22020 [Gemmata obscuriglobus]
MLIEEFNPRTGAQLSLKEKHYPEVPAKTFALASELAKGGYAKTWSADTYRITDVKVGDRVYIHYDRKDGVDTCRTIRILRRPGGVVPPPPGEKALDKGEHHGRMNAHQAWEEKRTPYPREYMPSFLDRDGLLYDSPYPSESMTIVIIPPKAPMPRLVRP